MHTVVTSFNLPPGKTLFVLALCACLAWCPATRAAEPDPPGVPPPSAEQAERETAENDKTSSEQTVSGWLESTPYLNDLLIDRDFPLIGGGWGAEIFVDVPLNGEPDGAQVSLRRAKLSYARRIRTHWRFKLTGDYSRGGGLEVSDAYVAYNGWDRTLLTLGISDPPFSLESVSQSAAVTFMERGLPVLALAERRGGNITLLRRNEHHILNASLVLFNVSQDNIREDGQGIVLHYVHSPVRIASAESVHLGASLSYRFNADESSTQFRSRPEVATVNDYFVDTGPIQDARNTIRLGLEASQVSGRFSWQSEVLGARVERIGKEPVNFWGAYAFASWFLTNDSRNYNFGAGDFEKVHVSSPFLEGGKGAFELAVRASLVDLSDQNVRGGVEKNVSVGLNWYVNKRIRFMTNLVKVLDVERPGSEFDGQDPLIFSLRAQWVLD